jgi:hypothetical protein
MKDENDPKNIKSFMINHPKFRIITTGGGIGTVGFAVGRMSGVISGIKLPVSAELFEKIWQTISNNAFAFLVIVICICITICVCFIMKQHYQSKLQKETLDGLSSILENSTMSSVKVKTEKGNIELSALKDTFETEKGPPKKHTNEISNNILKFRNSDDLEAK